MTLSNMAGTQAEYVRDRIQKQIFDGDLRPGQRVDEKGIAEAFGTSRTPVREALTQLVSSGLLQKSARQGAFVSRLNLEQTLELVEFSAELAAACARFAARRMTDADRAALRAYCGRMAAHLEANDVAAYTTEASLFHSAIIQNSRNSFLIEAIKRSVVQLSGYFRFELTYPGSIRKDLEDHHALLDAFDRADPDHARVIMRRHALLSADVIRDYFTYLQANTTIIERD